MLVQFDIRTEKAINSIVKALETIAECMLKSNEMAREALKMSQILYEANVKENKVSPTEYDGKIEVKLQTPDSDTPIVK